MLSLSIRRLRPANTAPIAKRFARNMTLQDEICRQQLANVRPVVYSKTPNGFRVACEHIPDTQFCTLGVWIDAGSRFETKENNGVAHFLEHLNFKGSENYTRKQIEDCFERLGAHFNAYTSRDRTAYYIKVFNKDVDTVLALLSDILQRGLYTPKDVEYERPTILAEMREVEMLVDEVIMDNLHYSAFDSSGDSDGLAFTILGPVENISKTITRDTVKEFVAKEYTAPRMMLVSSGGLTPDQVHRYGETYFGGLPSHSNRRRLSAKYVGGQHVMWNREMMTTHTAVAFPICGAAHPDCVPLQLLHNIVGQYHKERHEQFMLQRYNGDRLSALGVFGSLEMWRPFFTPYEDVSLLGYHFVTLNEPQQQGLSSAGATLTPGAPTAQSKVLQYFLRSVYELADTGPDAALLEQAKCDYKAAQLMMTDSTTNSAEDLGRQMIHFGHRVTPTSLFEQVDSVTPASFRDTLAKYVLHVVPTVATIGNPWDVPAYDEMLRLKWRASV